MLVVDHTIPVNDMVPAFGMTSYPRNIVLLVLTHELRAHRMEQTGVTYKEQSRYEVYDIEDDHFTGSVYGLQMTGMKAQQEVVDASTWAGYYIVP